MKHIILKDISLHKSYKRFPALFIFFFASVLTAYAQFYSGSQMEFGKNRVQYQQVNWTYYSYDKYEVYFYEGGRDVANYVSLLAKKNIPDIEKFIDFQLEDKLQFIVYNRQSDFQQSNLGLVSEEQYNVGGVTKIVGSKIMLYYEGDHQKLEQQLRAGVAEVLINQMLYGGNVKDMLKNSTLLALPDWYVQGLVSYIANDWSVDIDNRVRDGILSGRYTKFNRLTGQDAVFAGHSIWHYVAETYGEQVVSNLLYMTKVSRNIESAFLFVLGVSVKNMSYEWLDSYMNRYSLDSSKTLPVRPVPMKKIKASRVYSQAKLSPDGKTLAYATNELGQYKVWLYDMAENKTKRIMKVGHKIDRITDYSYPLLAWHPSGKILSMIVEKKSEVKLINYNMDEKKKEERPIINFVKILDFSYSDDGRKFVMSAVQKGQSDIYVFVAASNGYEQITNDIYDDLHPRFVFGSTKIAFSSNRINDTIRTLGDKSLKILPSTKDIFVYDYAKKSQILKRVTNTPLVDEDQPSEYDAINISYLSPVSGINNRYLANFDSVISYIDTAAHYRDVITISAATNYSRNIIEQNLNAKSKKYTEVLFYNGKYRMYMGDIVDPTAMAPVELKNTAYVQSKILEQKRKEKLEKEMADTLRKLPKDVKVLVVDDSAPKRDSSSSIDITNYAFENDPNTRQPIKVEVPQVVKADSLPPDPLDNFQLGRQKNYYLNYSTDYVVSQLDNTFLNQTYQKFTGGGSPIYLNPGFTGFFKIGLSDLFEDYKITAGVRLSGDLNSNEYFISHENRIKNLDKQIVLHRQALLNVTSSASLIKVHTHDAKYVLKWPFSEVASLRGTLSIRNDRTVFMATDLVNLKRLNEYQTWGGAKVEYVFDNTIKKGLNLYNGLRFKIFGEYYRQVDKEETDMFVVGADFRHYQKIHRDIIWANRVAFSTSFGRQKLVYYMGGVDNWFSPKFDNSINVATDQNYAYQTLATNMRGFYQNIRNGNSFAVINSELRVPIFKYLMNKPIKSDFISNFQIIGFGDIGTAWTDKTPYSGDNSLNKTIKASPGNPITITIYNQKDPIVGGYGFGFRSRLWGYFVRIDWAWGVEDRVVLPPDNDPLDKGKPTMRYLSFTLDF